MTDIVLLPGDGIGPEIVEAVCEILDKAGANLCYHKYDIGNKRFRNGKSDYGRTRRVCGQSFRRYRTDFATCGKRDCRRSEGNITKKDGALCEFMGLRHEAKSWKQEEQQACCLQ